MCADSPSQVSRQASNSRWQPGSPARWATSCSSKYRGGVATSISLARAVAMVLDNRCGCSSASNSSEISSGIDTVSLANACAASAPGEPVRAFSFDQRSNSDRAAGSSGDRAGTATACTSSMVGVSMVLTDSSALVTRVGLSLPSCSMRCAMRLRSTSSADSAEGTLATSGCSSLGVSFAPGSSLTDDEAFWLASGAGSPPGTQAPPSRSPRPVRAPPRWPPASAVTRHRKLPVLAPVRRSSALTRSRPPGIRSRTWDT